MMKLIEINYHPTVSQLRQFGVICLIGLPLLGWVWGAGMSTLVILAVIGLVLAAVGAVMPAVLRPIFLGLTIIASPIGMLIGELAMLMIYFGLFLPMGLFFRIVGRDALHLKINKSGNTYWQPKKTPEDVAAYYRQS